MTQSKMENLDTINYFPIRYYKLNKALLSMLGQWPHQSVFGKKFGFRLMTLALTLQLMPQFFAVYEFRDDTLVIWDLVVAFLVDCVCVTKLSTLMFRQNNMKTMLNQIDLNWKIWANEPGISILHEYAELARKFTIFYTVAVFGGSYFYLLEPVLAKVRNVMMDNGTAEGGFPIPLHFYGFDYQKYYFYLCGFSVVCIFMFLLIIVAHDAMYAQHVLHVCGLLSAIGHKLELLGVDKRSENNDDDYKFETIERDRDLKCIAVCVERHSQTIAFAEMVESTYTWGLLSLLLIVVMLLSVSGLEVVLVTGNLEETIKFIVFVGIQLLHLFVQCKFAQSLSDHSENLGSQVYASEWYNVAPKDLKLLQLTLLRSQRECKLTAGRLFVMNIQNFGAIIKTSFSYFTILRSSN